MSTPNNTTSKETKAPKNTQPSKPRVGKGAKVAIAAVTAALLTGGAVFGGVTMFNASQSNKVADLTTQLNEVETQIATVVDETTAFEVLELARSEETTNQAQQWTAWGKLEPPTLVKDHTEVFTQAGKTLSELSVPEPDEAVEQQVEQLKTAVTDARKEAGDTWEYPEQFLAYTAADVVELLDRETAPVTHEVPEEANSDVVQELSRKLQQVRERHDDLVTVRDETQKRADEYTKMHASVLDDVTAVAEALPSQAKEVLKQAPKADKELTDTITKTAKTAADTAKETLADEELVTASSQVTAVSQAVLAYLNAAGKAQSGHAAKVKAEREAAERAAVEAGAGSYVDPVTGNTVDVPQSAWDTWSGGGGSSSGSSGGSWSGGGGSSSGSSGGSWSGGGGSSGGSTGGSSGGGSAPAPTPAPAPAPAPPQGGTVCPPKPGPGWTHSGATGNGCPLWQPPMDEDDWFW